jgi:periplasmic protein TonB
VSENRFLQSCSALLASAILVCGTHLLLIASSEYDRPDGDLQPVPMATPAPSAAPAVSREAIEVEVTDSTPDRSHPEPASFAGDQTQAAAPAEANSPEPVAEPANEPVQTTQVEGPASVPNPPSSEIEEQPVTSAVEPATPAPEPIAPAAEPSEAAKPAEPTATAEAETEVPAETQVAEAVAPDTSQPEPVVPAAEPSEMAQPVGSTKTAEVETKASPEPQVAETAPSPPPVQAANAQQTNAAEAPTPTVPAAPEPNAAQTVIADGPAAPAPVVTAPEPPSEPKVAEANSTTPSSEIAEVPQAPSSVPLPTRKPTLPATVKTAKAVKQTAPAAASATQQAAAESKPRWTPMSLAPADKDTVAKPKLTPERAQNAGGYNAKIWSALARHKPRAGKAGSAAVTFSIGPAGGLRSARISGSSGDAQLDQMALQTVRNAAPFPPPPNPATASYTIRIYFR